LGGGLLDFDQGSICLNILSVFRVRADQWREATPPWLGRKPALYWRNCQFDRILEHLKAHHVEARIEHLQVTEAGLMDTLSNLAADNAGLIVMGASGGYGFPLLSRGSGMRYVLRHMTAPCLFSH
jgi:hypothetical protein